MTHRLPIIVLAGFSAALPAQCQTDDSALRRSVEELRHTAGRWEAMTDFLDEDGSVAMSVTGTYEFSWVVPDRVLAGRSAVPELKQAAGLLLFINEAEGQTEMASVGADGHLWIMTGPLGGDQRISHEHRSQRLRFTRFNVSPDSFESRMEISSDGGKTWRPGNHQRFRRVAG